MALISQKYVVGKVYYHMVGAVVAFLGGSFGVRGRGRSGGEVGGGEAAGGRSGSGAQGLTWGRGRRGRRGGRGRRALRLEHVLHGLFVERLQCAADHLLLESHL